MALSQSGSDYIARSYMDASAGADFGIFKLGSVGGTAYSGNAFTNKVGGGFYEGAPSGHLNLSPGVNPIKVGIGASMGVEVGSYSNW